MDISISSGYIKDRFSNKIQSRGVSYLKKPAVYHTLFWVSYFTLNTLRWGSYFDDYGYSLLSNLVEFPIHIVLVYFNLYYLLPRFIPNKFGQYFGLLLLATVGMSLLRIVLTYELVTTDVWRENIHQETNLFDFNYIMTVVIGEVYVVGLTTAIKITMDYVKNQKRTRELEKQSLETELSMLKSQLQPHFFFNTLNNLYSLTLDKSDQAPETVLKLSDLMSYVIYQTKNKQVPLTGEVKHIKNYLDLESLRYGDRLNIEFMLSGNLEGHSVPPLLLLPFVENAFKHGAHNETKSIPINIALHVENGLLTFSVKNQKAGKNAMNTGNNKGLGLANTKRRLGLLYNGQHELSINEDSNTYSTTLKIPVT